MAEGSGMVPRTVWTSPTYSGMETPEPTAVRPQELTCADCVRGGGTPVTPRVIVMVNGTSLCLAHAR